jgi:Xaa-Pro aminopeptidase
VSHFRRLEKLFPEAAFEDVGRIVMRQRAVKSAWEVDRVRAAAAVADAVSRVLPDLLEEGLTEVEFAGRVEAEARRLGHEGYIRMRGFNQEMFYGQLLTGVSGCVPSYLDTPLAGTGLSPSVAQGASFRRIGRGEPVVFDFVPVRDGYMADFTRMYSLGPLAGALMRAFDVALRVQEAATAAARPGATCRAVWDAARATAAEAGLAAHFMGYGAGQVPYVGHGIGIELDEVPVLTGSDLVLEPGMVFALEPKFVLPGHGAVGIENTWVVTDEGAERITLAPDVVTVVK